MSYGPLPNTHLIQKYGFVERNNPVKQIIVRFPYHDYSALLYEEQTLKKELATKLKIPMNPNVLAATLHTGKFDATIMQQLRLSFLSSKTIMDLGGTHSIEQHDFKSKVDNQSERMAYDFLIENLEKHLGNLKPQDHY
jgi:hypothetical protein